MGRIVGTVAGAIVVAAGVLAVYGYGRVVSLEVEHLGDDVYVLRGLGGNVSVLATDAGAVVVDSMTFRLQGERIRERAEALGRGPVQAVINTHYHVDHTHGNPGFAPGSRVVATRRTLDYLRAFDADYWEGGAEQTLPNDVFDHEHEMRIGGKTIRSIHPGRGHTGGDLVVLFVEDRVLSAGDLVFRLRYPNIDLEAGGSIPAWIETLDRVLALDFDRVIPGHGPTTDKEGIRAFQRFLRELWAVGQEAAREGLTLEQTLSSKTLREDEGYGVIGVPFVFRLDERFVIQRAWQEASGAVSVRPLPTAARGEEP